jgi:hypothetical protein
LQTTENILEFDVCHAVLQIPFCVVIGWMMGQKMDLNFQLFETATLFITVLVVAFMLQVGFHGGYNFVQCARKNSNG